MKKKMYILFHFNIFQLLKIYKSILLIFSLTLRLILTVKQLLYMLHRSLHYQSMTVKLCAKS